MVWFDVFAVVAVQLGEFGRHPLESLVVVFARGRRQSWLRGGVIVRRGGCLYGRHDIWGGLHGEGGSCGVVNVSEGLWSCCHASLLRRGGRASMY